MAQASSTRLSVRGAFGPSGALFKGGAASSKGAEALPSRAHLFQLDKCLDKNNYIVPGLGDFGDRYYSE